MKNYSVDLENLPPLDDQQKAEIQALSESADSEINYNDIPASDDSFWLNAVRNPFYKPVKTSTTLRLDSDVLAWFKNQGRGYQTRMNDILRQAMIHALQKS
jgi:uncharacterized protein (DUF4415 family)